LWRAIAHGSLKMAAKVITRSKPNNQRRNTAGGPRYVWRFSDTTELPLISCCSSRQ
jgi:hypothetical protein